jgi:DNA-binding MarR family transcriptional regulator
MQDVEERTAGKLRLSAGALYGSIKRMLELGLILEAPGKSGEDERRRCYRLTPLRKKTARAESERMAETLRYARSSGLDFRAEWAGEVHELSNNPGFTAISLAAAPAIEHGFLGMAQAHHEVFFVVPVFLAAAALDA